MTESDQISLLSSWLDRRRLEACMNKNNEVPYRDLLNITQHHIQDTNLHLVNSSLGVLLSGLLNMFSPADTRLRNCLMCRWSQ